MKKKSILILLIFSNALCVMAQGILPDTIMLLDTVNISAERYVDFSAGQKVEFIDQSILEENIRNNIGNILRENTAVYIRSYGQNTLSSMSFRGTSSSQSSIFWNGINVRMPSLGSTDLSMIPSSFFNNAAIVYGGNSIRYGSGTIGGAVFLNNEAKFKKAVYAGVDLYAGSFGSMGTSISSTVADTRYYFKISASAQQARNDFNYTNEKGEEKVNENAAGNGLGVNVHGAVKICNISQAELFLWYQEALKEIPPTTTMNTSKAYQSDRAFRSSLQWKSVFNHGILKLKTAWFNENENFTDPLISLQSSIKTNTAFFESEYKHQVHKNGMLDVGVSYTLEKADIDAYNGIKDRAWFALFVNYKQHIPKIKWSLVVGARQEFNKNNLSPFSPSLGIEGPIISWLSNKASISRNFRLPTMNELYWQPGGNPDIKPESSWNAEYSLIAMTFKDKKYLNLKFSATAYGSMVDDWIQWLPGSNALWYADNVKTVWARGVESSIDFDLQKGKNMFDLGISYTYSKSTNEDNSDPNTEGKQLMYIPLHNASGKLAYSIEKWKAMIYGTYTGDSYITSDNKHILPGFFLLDFAVRKDFSANSYMVNISARLNNILNKQYQAVAYRPMPGINFQLSVSLTFKN